MSKDNKEIRVDDFGNELRINMQGPPVVEVGSHKSSKVSIKVKYNDGMHLREISPKPMFLTSRDEFYNLVFAGQDGKAHATRLKTNHIPTIAPH